MPLLMQVPPIRNLPKNEHINERFNFSNDTINLFPGDGNYKVANVYDLIKALPGYDSLYCDDLHFRHKQGVLFSKKKHVCFLSCFPHLII